MDEGSESLKDQEGRKESAVGTDNPRFKRYHNIVSAPELWNPDAVAKALAILRAEQATEEEPEMPPERHDRPEEHAPESAP